MSSVPNNYEINIAKRTKLYPQGEHWGRLQIPEWRKEDAEAKLHFLRELFGDEYHISMTYWNCSGHCEDDWK